MTTKGDATIAAAASAQHSARRPSAAAFSVERNFTAWAQLEPEPATHGDLPVLHPGVSYVLKLTLAQAAPGEPVFAARGDLVLQARWAGEPDVHVDDRPIEVSLPTLPDAFATAEFHFDVSKDARRTIGDLMITAKDRVTGRPIPDPIYTCSAEIAAEFLAPPRWFAETPIRLDRKPEPRLAVLHVHGAGEQILVNGFHPSAMPLESARIGRPSIDFVRIEQEKADENADDHAEKIINHVIDYSQQGLRHVHRWLKEVLHQFDAAATGTSDKPAIIIVEQVASRVPWEMLSLEDKTVLGARVIVTRWIVISHDSTTIELDPAAVHGRHGHVLSYVDGLEEKLNDFGAALKVRSREQRSIRTLAKELRAEPNGLALVMLTCHGIFERPESAGQYGSEKNEHDRITRLDLVEIATPVGPRPLVFVNACHSARLTSSNEDTTRLPVGLPEVFLRGYARGYLGAVGEISLEFAAEFGACILDQASTFSGVCVAELLFERRRRAAANRANDPETFVNTFMYVFYGSPHDRLLLAAGISPGGAP
jgi:hypothetical protein